MALTAKQEAFCIAYLETGNASEAYRQAYNTKAKMETVNRSAKELMDNPKIATRLVELMQPAVNAAQITLEGHLQELANIRDLAVAAGQYSAATTAEANRGKVAGLYVEQTADVTKDYVARLPDKSDNTSEWQKSYGSHNQAPKPH